MKRFAIIGLMLVGLGGCALDPFTLEGTDQIAGIGPSAESVVKSLRCEIVTFIVENKLRAQEWTDTIPGLKKLPENSEEFQQAALMLATTFPYLDIDSKQYGSMQGDFKYIDSLTAGLGFDWKYVLTPVTTRTYAAGPSYSQTRTFESIQAIAIPQNADLGSTKSWVGPGEITPITKKYTTLYNRQPKEDLDFFCYSSFFNSKAQKLLDAIDDVQQLVLGSEGTEKLINFHRVYVGQVTLAKWLQDQATKLSLTYRTFRDNTENFLPGQFEYTFTLDVKPSITASYSLTHQIINPFIPSISVNLEHSTNFSIFLNTVYSVPALQAKGGNSCIGVIKNSVCTAQPISVSALH
jgi:hypothetical protein